MTQIILSDEQVQAVHAAQDPVELRDREGNLLGYFSRKPSDAEIAAARQRLNSAGPWHTTDQVLGHLDSLEQG